MSLSNLPAEVLRKHYSHTCPGPIVLRPVRAAEVNSHNWFVHLNDETAPRFVLKKKGGPDKISIQQWQNTVCEYSRATAKTKLLPKLLPADHGELFVEEEGAFFRLMEFRSGNLFAGLRTELRSCGEALGEINLAIRNSSLGDSSPLYKNLSPAEQTSVLKHPQKNMGPGDFGWDAIAWVAKEAPARYAEIEFIESQTNLPRHPVHHDFMPQNLLFQDNRVTAVLDPDSLVVDFQMHAVTFAASRLSPEKLGWDFLAGYHSVIPLTVAELRLLPAFIRREAVRRINWILRVNFLLGGNAWRMDLYKHRHNIDSANAWEAEFAMSDDQLLEKIQNHDGGK
jgi:Ser/Thr protein kinase RdoA (MazF antagonist)